MSVVDPLLEQTIRELQLLPSLKDFALAGGTNLALLCKHRRSDDIDLFCDHIIGFKGFSIIQKEIEELYGDRVIGYSNPCDISDQYLFSRCFISLGNGTTVKVEMLQNMKRTQAIELHNEIRFISKKDIGLYKLESLCNRNARKDVYDLDLITDDIPLLELYQGLEEKYKTYNSDIDKNIFDLDGRMSPVEDLSLLLKFDETGLKNNSKRHTHSSDNIVVAKDAKSWTLARLDWRAKVRGLYNDLDQEFPRIIGKSI